MGKVAYFKCILQLTFLKTKSPLGIGTLRQYGKRLLSPSYLSILE
jgi:hypothetical protein